MKEPLAFLKSLSQTPYPPVVHLLGEDSFIRRIVREKLFEAWGSTDLDTPVESLVGSEAAQRFSSSGGGGGSLFSTKRIVWISDPPSGEKRKGPNPLSSMGKNQIASFVQALKSLDAATEYVLVETPGLKKTAQLAKALEDITVQVDAGPPAESGRARWIGLIAKKMGLGLAPDLAHRLEASSIPLETLFKDLEKVWLATELGDEAELETWQSLTQAEAEASIWEIGEALGRGEAAKALAALKALEDQGVEIYPIVGALQTWNNQRIQVKAALDRGGSQAPEGIHPFVFKKMRDQVAKVSLERLREEQRALLHLDRALKQSWENPHTLLERLIVEMGTGGRTWKQPSVS